MSERIRGALFNTLGDITDLTFLDAFAGSGALSFEALSRGASRALLIDRDKNAQQAIAQNIIRLRLEDRAKLIRANTFAWSRRNAGQLFDIILCDPPYDNLQVPLIQNLSDHLKANGLLVLSWPGDGELPVIPRSRLLSNNHFGDSQLVFYTAKA